MLDRLIKGTANAVVATAEGADDVLTALRTAVKNQVVGTFKDVGEVGGTGMAEVVAITTGGQDRRETSETSPSSVDGRGRRELFQPPSSASRMRRAPAMLGATTKAARGVVTGAAEIGSDLGTTAVAAVKGAVEAAGTVGVGASDAAGAAATGALRAATDIGTDAASTVRTALLSAAELPRDAVEAAVKGSSED